MKKMKMFAGKKKQLKRFIKRCQIKKLITTNINNDKDNTCMSQFYLLLYIVLPLL